MRGVLPSVKRTNILHRPGYGRPRWEIVFEEKMSEIFFLGSHHWLGGTLSGLGREKVGRWGISYMQGR